MQAFNEKIWRLEEIIKRTAYEIMNIFIDIHIYIHMWKKHHN